MQLQNLCSLRLNVEEDLLKELGRLPEDLADTYAQIFEYVRKLGPQSHVIAERSLKWLLCQARDLSEAEFLAAISIGTERDSVNLTKEKVLFICGNLVIFDHELKVFRFAHLSVREYLEAQSNFTLDTAHAFGAEITLLVCLRRYTDFAAQYARKFRRYAFLYWLYHCREARKSGLSSLLHQLLEDFLHRRNGTNLCYAAWARSMRRLKQASEAYDSGSDDEPSEQSEDESIDGMYEAWQAGINIRGSFYRFQTERDQSILESILDDRDYPYDPTSAACFLDLPEIVEQNLLAKFGDIVSDDIKVFERQNLYGETYLHMACQRGSSKLLRLLLQYPIPVHAKDLQGRTALHYTVLPYDLVSFKSARWTETVRDAHDPAIAAERLAMIGLLIEKANINDAAEVNGETALHLAINANFCTEAQFLLEHEAFVDARTHEGQTPLHLAAELGHTTVARILLQFKADIEARDCRGGTPLLLAADLGHTSVAQVLLESNADIESRNFHERTPLLQAADSGHTAVARLLLQSKADIEARDGYGGTPLFLSAMRGNIDTVRLLLLFGADTKVKNSRAVENLAGSLLMRQEAMTQMLVDRIASIKEWDFSGKTVLHYAAVSSLETDLYGSTPVHVAIKPPGTFSKFRHGTGKAFRIVRLLVDAGADVETSDDGGQTPLHLAAQTADELSVQVLLDLGADIKAQDDKGLLPLDHAAISGSLPVFKLLCKRWSDARAESNECAIEPWRRLAARPGNRSNGVNLETLQKWRTTSIEDLIELSTSGSEFLWIWAERGPEGFNLWYRVWLIVTEMRRRARRNPQTRRSSYIKDGLEIGREGAR